MMGRVDMFCAADDRHRVALLEELLQQAGQPVTLHAQPVAEASAPCLVACTARSLKEAWIVELFAAHPSVVALRLDDTPLPGPCMRAVDLQSWPARSADRQVGALVTWLSTLSLGGSAVRPPAGAASSSRSAQQGEMRPRRGLRRHGSDTRRAMIVLGVLLAGGYLLWASAPERSRGDTPPDPPATAIPVPEGGIAGTEFAQSRSGPTDTSVLAHPADSAGAIYQPRLRPSTDSAGALAADTTETRAPIASTIESQAAEAEANPLRAANPAVLLEESPGSGGDDGIGDAVAIGDAAADSRALELDEASQSAAQTPVPLPLPPEAAADDALARLCRARSFAAAEAWAGALDWKQRRRAASTPCVERLLARPGYRTLRPLLDLP